MEEQVSEVEREVIITNNNLLFHFGGHNSKTMERCIKSDSALAPQHS